MTPQEDSVPVFALTPAQQAVIRDLAHLLPTGAEIVSDAQRAKGFHDDVNAIADVLERFGGARGMVPALETMFAISQLGLMGTEVAEMIEAVRKPGPAEHIVSFTHDFTQEEEESADLLIRLLHYSGRRGLRLGLAFAAKMEYNLSRPHKHGKRA